jgi:hypothetical protein
MKAMALWAEVSSEISERRSWNGACRRSPRVSMRSATTAISTETEFYGGKLRKTVGEQFEEAGPRLGDGPFGLLGRRAGQDSGGDLAQHGVRGEASTARVVLPTPANLATADTTTGPSETGGRRARTWTARCGGGSSATTGAGADRARPGPLLAGGILTLADHRYPVRSLPVGFGSRCRSIYNLNRFSDFLRQFQRQFPTQVINLGSGLAQCFLSICELLLQILNSRIIGARLPR